MYYITLGYFFTAGLIYFFFTASPEEIGVKLESEACTAVVENPDDFQRASESSNGKNSSKAENEQ